MEHRQLSETAKLPMQRQTQALLWKTCVRELQVGLDADATEPLVAADVEVYRGSQAAVFLAEVVSGLHSPLMGETEVHGQYKDLLRLNMERLPAPLREALLGVHFLAKQTRQLHLRGLGSQSYGSLARKKLKACERIFIFGAGHLAEEILPWLSKTEKSLQVYARDPRKAENLRQLFPKLCVLSRLDEVDPQLQAIIVAAPVSASDMQKFIAQKKLLPMQVLDFRAESRNDPVEGPFETISLHQMFAEIQNCKTSVAEKVEAAHQFIRQSVNESLQHIERVAKTSRAL